jgi:ectoine hydroxylase-related dioxygenase (phytanoyl-CoA dioxygenase family)
MDDATIENGCLWILPGSHRPGYIYPSKAPTDLVEYDGSFECYGFDPSAAVPVEVAAGSVVFFNGYVLHKSLRNRTTGTYRRALVNHYMNSGSLLQWPDPSNGDNRCVIPVAGKDPYAWKGYAQPGDDVYLREFGKPWGDDKGKAGNPS